MKGISPYSKSGTPPTNKVRKAGVEKSNSSSVNELRVKKTQAQGSWTDSKGNPQKRNTTFDQSKSPWRAAELDDVSLHKLIAQKKQQADDMTLVSNRIRLLQTEESRVLKKIEQARKRAEQIMLIQKNQEDKYNLWSEIEQKRELIQDKIHDEVQVRKEELIHAKGHKLKLLQAMNYRMAKEERDK